MLRKLLLLCAFAMMMFFFAYGQCITRRDSMLYAKAYEYIKNDSVGKAHWIFPSNRLIRTTYNYLTNSQTGTMQCNIDSLNTVTEADLSRLKLSADRTGRWLALRMKVDTFDRHSLDGVIDTLRYTFPIIRPERMEGAAIPRHVVELPPRTELHWDNDTLGYTPYSRVTYPFSNGFAMHFSRIFNNEFFVELDQGLKPWGISYFYYFNFGPKMTLKRSSFGRSHGTDFCGTLFLSVV